MKDNKPKPQKLLNYQRPNSPKTQQGPQTAPPTTKEAGENTSATLPVVYVPGGGVRIIDTAKKLGRAMRRAVCLFVRGKALCQVVALEGRLSLEVITSVRLRSLAEECAALYRHSVTVEGEVKSAPAILSKDASATLLETPQFFGEFREVAVLSPCPVLVAHQDGKLHTVAGYDPESRVLAHGQVPSIIPIEEARTLLLELLADNRFSSEADRSRAVAALITPALVHGGLIEGGEGRAPLFLLEANASQAGKGYAYKLVAALYNHEPASVAIRRRGVGGIEEGFDLTLISGHFMVCFDNLRGLVDLPAVESFLTEPLHIARIPYAPPVTIDTRRIVLFATSNEAELTRDLANRALCVRILKQPIGRTFRRFREGDLLAHVRANRSRYLGAVFALVRAWWDAGAPRTNDGRHDFRAACQILDWIVQNLLRLPPLLDGHEYVHQRMTNSALSWLRRVAVAVIAQHRGGHWLRAADLVEICEAAWIDIPGVDATRFADEAKYTGTARQLVGRKLKACFNGADTVVLDRIKVTRNEDEEDREDHGTRTMREYLFEQVDDEAIAPDVPAAAETPDTPEPTEDLPPPAKGGGVEFQIPS